MSAITIILILELVASSLLVSLPVSHPKKDPRTLGQNIYLAQDGTPPADQPAATDQSNPADQTPPPDQVQPVPEQPAPSENPPQSTETPAPESSSSANPQTASPASSPQAQAQTPAEQTPEQSASTSADLPILNTDELTNNLSQINPQSQEEAAKEDGQLTAITDPTVKAAALTTFASEKISDIDKFTRDQDFNSTAFAGQRLSDQIDQLKTLSSQIPTNEQIQQKLSDLCQQTSTTLRTSQEIVPEELEQDMEMTRGQCLGY